MFFEAKEHSIKGMRYPLSVNAQATPPITCDLVVGDLVTYTNCNGVIFPDLIVTGFSPTVENGRFIYFDQSAWWFPESRESLTKQVRAEDAHEASEVKCSDVPRG